MRILKIILKGLLIGAFLAALIAPYVLINRLDKRQQVIEKKVSALQGGQLSTFLVLLQLGDIFNAIGEKFQEIETQLTELQIAKTIQTVEPTPTEPSSTSISEKPTYDYLKSVTVIIFQEGLEDPAHGSLGTGTILKTDDTGTYVLTNKHVCNPKDGGNCYIMDKLGKGKTKVLASVYKTSIGSYDVQILHTDTPIKDKVAIKGIASAKPSDPVYLVGHHLGRPYIYGEGVFAGYEAHYIDVIQIPILWGDSGSGVFDKNGYLVGVMYAGNVQEQEGITVWDVAHGLAVDSDVVRYLVQGVL